LPLLTFFDKLIKEGLQNTTLHLRLQGKNSLCLEQYKFSGLYDFLWGGVGKKINVFSCYQIIKLNIILEENGTD
jgi:hypothetical protein